VHRRLRAPTVGAPCGPLGVSSAICEHRTAAPSANQRTTSCTQYCSLVQDRDHVIRGQVPFVGGGVQMLAPVLGRRRSSSRGGKCRRRSRWTHRIAATTRRGRRRLLGRLLPPAWWWRRIGGSTARTPALAPRLEEIYVDPTPARASARPTTNGTCPPYYVITILNK